MIYFLEHYLYQITMQIY